MKSEKELKDVGRFMSLILRHAPEKADIEIDIEGWTDIKTLLKKLKINSDELDWILNNNNKNRFSYNENKTKVRANQGHSLSYVQIEFDIVSLEETPEYLYHGTSTTIFPILLKEGINKMKRTHVHLSKDEETAINVGGRKSSNIAIVKIKAKDFVNDGNRLFISKNGVYLADYIPVKYLESTPIYIKIL